MRKKAIPTMTWEEAPDIIMPKDLANILGIGIENARVIFDKPDFPKISKKDIGNIGKADKEAARLYIQGVNLKKDNKNALLYMILTEIKKLNERGKNNVSNICNKNDSRAKRRYTRVGKRKQKIKGIQKLY